MPRKLKRMFSVELDELDEAAINKAIAVHQRRIRVEGEHILPEGDSCVPGATLAEVCRNWLESIGEWKGRGD